jgi:cytochrome P450
MMPFASTLAPKPYNGRAAVQSALMKYYSARHDLEPDVSRLAKVRAAVCREYGFTDLEIGKMEVALLQVATSNAIPTSFWTLIFIASSPSLVASIRQELMYIFKVISPKKELSLNISCFSSHCPLLVSTYQEATRLANSQVVTRRVMADTTISDGKSSYLLKKGADVQMPAGVNHMASTNWGTNASDFDARRFLQREEKASMNDKEKEEFKTQKRSFFPFGGGKHLCPGRSFAFAEILGTIAILVLGFDITGSDGELLKVPKIGRASLAEAIVKPGADGLKIGAKFTRRKGWENVVWSFHTDQE